MSKVKHASHYEELENKKIKCLLCPHYCVIPEEKKGVCGVRQNVQGQLVSLNYGQIAAIQLDPIEKKPLYHFYPGKNIVSVGTYGCNFRCSFCQNWHLSKGRKANWELKPDQLIKKITAELAGPDNNIGIAFTYNEPLVWYENILEASKLAQKEGLKVVLVTNGYLNPEPFFKLLNFVDAINIDLKSFQEHFYREYCGGSLKPVLTNIEAAQKMCHVEITTLVITDLNESKEELTRLAAWLGDLNEDIPLHLSRYFPNYKLDKPPTAVEKMLEAKKIAAEYLHYVYLGNLPQLKQNSTYCPKCQVELIARDEYKVEVKGLVKDQGRNNFCSRCGEKIAVIL